MTCRQPYRPRNGSEGEIFMERWCSRCIKDMPEDACEILTSVYVLDIDDPDYPPELQYDPVTGPLCTGFALEHGKVFESRCPLTADLFGGRS